LEWVREERPSVPQVRIFSNSRYVIDNIPRACHWQKNGWKNTKGRPVEHALLWKQFLTAWSEANVRVYFGWAKGKAHVVRKRVDQAVKRAARTGRDIDRGYIVGKTGRARTEGGW
jgi:ribonuclease HI